MQRTRAYRERKLDIEMTVVRGKTSTDDLVLATVEGVLMAHIGESCHTVRALLPSTSHRFGQGNRNCFGSSNMAGFPLNPIRHRQLIDRLTQHRIHIGVYVVRELWAGVLKQPLCDSGGDASLSQQRGKCPPQIVELQFGYSELLAYLVPSLGAESVGDNPLLPICECGDMVGQLRHDLIWNRSLRHRFPCLAVPGGDGVSVKVKVTNADSLNVPASESCRHGQ